MFVLKHILWIIVTLYIHALLPLVCNASTEIKDNWMEDDESIDTKILLKLRRRLLDTGNHNEASEFLFYMAAVIFITIVGAYIKCCMEMVRRASEEDTSHITQHPPPACRITDISTGSTRPLYSTRLPSSSRPLAPPRTSTSIILLPKERQFDSLFIGISNPLYNASISNEQVRNSNTSISNEQVRRDVNISTSNEQVRRDVNSSIFTEQVRREFNSPISNEQERSDRNPPQNPTDMPPNYESAVKDDEKYTVYNIQDGPPYDEPPPKYSEF